MRAGLPGNLLFMLISSPIGVLHTIFTGIVVHVLMKALPTRTGLRGTSFSPLPDSEVLPSKRIEDTRLRMSHALIIETGRVVDGGRD
jgi:hypothetical protein